MSEASGVLGWVVVRKANEFGVSMLPAWAARVWPSEEEGRRVIRANVQPALAAFYSVEPVGSPESTATRERAIFVEANQLLAHIIQKPRERWDVPSIEAALGRIIDASGDHPEDAALLVAIQELVDHDMLEEADTLRARALSAHGDARGGAS